MSYLEKYLKKHPLDSDKGAISFIAGLDHLKEHSPDIANAIISELNAQRSHLKLIASENYSSLAVQIAMGNLLTDKYAEGYPEHRFYAGCENVDTCEAKASLLLKEIYGCDHAYVQPHSGADANLLAFWAILVHKIQNQELKKHNKRLDELSHQEYEIIRKMMCDQKMIGMALDAGGHLTHGYIHNVSSKFFRASTYTLDPTTELLDYQALQEKVKQEKPLILLAGYSAYPRRLNFAKLKTIADSVNAVLMVDMAHFSGLVAGKVFKGEEDPVPYADMITSTTHKTLRGPRGGMVLCTKEYEEVINKGCPLIIGGPLPHVMAAKAIAFSEANTLSFQNYADQIVKNASAMAEGFIEEKTRLITGGTDNHLLVADVTSFGLTGKQAENALIEAGITLNRNAILNDKNGAWYTSGIRLGPPAITTRGMKEKECKQIAKWIVKVLKNTKPNIVQKTGKPSLAKSTTDPKVLKEVQEDVGALLNEYPLYPEIDLS